MAEADYRLMTEATGQRIAAALEALHLATVTGVKGATEANYRHGDVNLTPENIGAFKQIPGYITREMLDNYNIKYWYGAKITAAVASEIGLPAHEWFVLNMSKDDDPASSWTRQVFFQLGQYESILGSGEKRYGSLIYQRTCVYQSWSRVTKLSIADDFGSAATVAQETIVGARSFVLHSYGDTYSHVGAIFKETGLQLWDYNTLTELWWFPKVIGTSSYSLITSYGAGITKYNPNVDDNNLRCIKFGNGLKRLTGLFNVTTTLSNGAQICVFPSGFSLENSENGSIPAFPLMVNTDGTVVRTGLMSGGQILLFSSNMPAGTYTIDQLYF